MTKIFFFATYMMLTIVSALLVIRGYYNAAALTAALTFVPAPLSGTQDEQDDNT